MGEVGGETETWGFFAASPRTTVSPSAPKDKAEAAFLPSAPMIPQAPCYIFQWCRTKCCWAVQDARAEDALPTAARHSAGPSQPSTSSAVLGLSWGHGWAPCCSGEDTHCPGAAGRPSPGLPIHCPLFSAPLPIPCSFVSSTHHFSQIPNPNHGRDMGSLCCRITEWLRFAGPSGAPLVPPLLQQGHTDPLVPQLLLPASCHLQTC